MIGGNGLGRQDILVVDDLATNRELLAAILEDAGLVPRVASSSELALQSALEQPPLLVLLDIRMPGMDGFEVGRQLKADERTRDVPIIFISGLDDLADRVRAFEVGGVDFIGKPFQREEILARVRVHLALHRTQTELEASVRQMRETEAAMDVAGIGLHRIDAKTGRILDANDFFCRAHGYARDELLAMSLVDIDPKLDPASFGDQLEGFRQLGAGRLETIHHRKDGPDFPVEIAFYHQASPSGEAGHFVSFMTDISKRRADAERMRLDAEQQAVLRELLETTLVGATVEDTLERCLARLLGVSWLNSQPTGGILLSKPGEQRLRMAVSHNLPAEIQTLCAEVRYGQCLCGRAAASRQVQFASHVDGRHEYLCADSRDHGHYCLPLLVNENVLGVLVLYLSPGALRDPEKEHFLAAVANILAGFISRKTGELALAEHQAALEATVQERTADLKASEARTRAILTTMLDSVIHIDDRGIILAVNLAVQDMFGYAEEELLGRNVSMLMTESDASAHDGHLARFRKTRQSHVLGGRREVVGRRKDGGLVPIELAVNEMVDDKGSTFIGVLRDITMRKAAEEQLKDALKAEQAAAEAKSAFLANMSHEIRTPLNGVLGLAQIGVRDSRDRQTAGLFERIRQSGGHLLEVVNDILDFSKIEAGKLKVEAHPFALFSVIDDVRSFVAMRAEEKGLRLDVSLAADLSDWVEGDSLRLTQILTNLLSNAIKFTPQGEVSLGVARDGKDLVFKVTDSGIGMSEEQLARLFQPFEQADSSITRSYGGTGLGLAISRRLTSLMGGDIAVDSRPGAGSSFYLRVPMPAVAAPGHEGAPAGAASQAGSRLKGLSVLAADDVDINRFVLEDLLAHEGAHVLSAADGRQALDLIEEKGVSAFDVVLMDVQMPVMDGLAATRRIRELAPALPVVGLTAHAMAEERDRCLAAGMVDHVAKPVDIDALVATIHRHVRMASQPECVSGPAPPAGARAPATAAFPGCDDPRIIDLGILGKRVGNDAAKIAKYAVRFVESARPGLADMKEAATAGDLPRLAAIAHRLKSTALTVGAVRFGEICNDLQSLQAADDPGPARAKVEQLPDLLDRIAASIERGLGEAR